VTASISPSAGDFSRNILKNISHCDDSKLALARAKLFH
jgi:hypothetical protein